MHPHPRHLSLVRDAAPNSPAPPQPAPAPAPARPIAPLDAAVAAALALLCARLFYATAPAVVNLDGLGYLKLLPHNFAAGHLLYMPLLRALTSLCRGDGLLAGHLLSAAAAGLSVALLYFCALAQTTRAAAARAAGGLAVSYAVWVQGADVEVYALALLAALAVLALALAYRAAPSTPRALALGAALGLAVLVHLTHVLLSPFVAVAILVAGGDTRDRRRGLAHAALALATGGALSLGAYAYAALHVRHHDLAGAVRWVATAGHGFRYDGTPLARASDAVYGLAKALVWSPYLYESNAQTLLAQLLLGLCALVPLGALVALRHREVRAALPAWPLAAWCLPYVAMALLFFGSDHERWIFVLPPLWLAAGVALDALPARRGALVGAALVAYLAVANAATAIGPARHDSWARTRADAAAAPMRAGDLVLFPGHSWDEYIGFYTGTGVIPFPIAYYAGRDGNDAMRARLDRDVRAARARGSRVFAARIFDDDDNDPRGRFELETLGLPRPALRALLTARFVAVPVATGQPKVTVWRLDDLPAAAPPR